MELETAQWLLAVGRDTMRSFEWQFPCDPVGLKLDTATEGFRKYYVGVNRQLSSLRRNSKGNSSLTDEQFFGTRPLEAVPGILNFLASMYSSGVRNSYRARIRYVVRVLEEHVAFFAGAVATVARQPGALPWHEKPHCNNLVSALCTASPQTDAETQEDESEQEEVKLFSSSDSSDEQEFSGLDNCRHLVDGEAPGGATDAVPGETAAETRQCNDCCLGATVESVSQSGQITVHNGLKQEIRLHVMKTKADQRLLPGKTVTLQVGVEELDVRIHSIGLLGLTSGKVLCKVRFRHMQCYTVVRATGKKVTCILV